MRIFHIFFFFFFHSSHQGGVKNDMRLGKHESNQKTEYACNIQHTYGTPFQNHFYYKMVAEIECFCILKFLISGSNQKIVPKTKESKSKEENKKTNYFN